MNLRIGRTARRGDCCPRFSVGNKTRCRRIELLEVMTSLLPEKLNDEVALLITSLMLMLPLMLVLKVPRLGYREERKKTC